MADTWLIVGLGNPGPRYETTRHNVGQMVVDELAGRRGESFREHKGGARVVETWLRPGAEKIVLAKPNSFMNVSGTPVAALARFYSVPPERTVVIHDELDIPFDAPSSRQAAGTGDTTASATSPVPSGRRTSRVCGSGSDVLPDVRTPPIGCSHRSARSSGRRCRSSCRMPRMPWSSSSPRGFSRLSRSITLRAERAAQAP
jgi:hypothetical protein